MDVALKHFQLQLLWTVKVASYLEDELVKLLIEEVILSRTRRGIKEYKNSKNLGLISKSTINSLKIWFIVAASVLEVFAPLSGETHTWLWVHTFSGSVVTLLCPRPLQVFSELITWISLRLLHQSSSPLLPRVSELQTCTHFKKTQNTLNNGLHFWLQLAMTWLPLLEKGTVAEWIKILHSFVSCPNKGRKASD